MQRYGVQNKLQGTAEQAEPTAPPPSLLLQTHIPRTTKLSVLNLLILILICPAMTKGMHDTAQVQYGGGGGGVNGYLCIL